MTNINITSHATPSLDIPKPREHATHATLGLAIYEQRAAALLTPPDSLPPDFSPFARPITASSSPPLSIDPGASSVSQPFSLDVYDDDDATAETRASVGVPLSRGALSGLNAAAAITPALLAKHHLPVVMLGNGPKPIRYVMGELTHTVPGFSRIPAAKARRLVVAALESRCGGGVDGNVTFNKTGWGRWDAQLKTSAQDSAMNPSHDHRLSPPRSERSSYALSHPDSGIQLHSTLRQVARVDRLGESWTASSLREEDEMYIDMDVPENDADKMSLDGLSDDDIDDLDELDELDDDTDDEVDWAAAGPAALRKASMSTSSAPRRDYNALSSSYRGRWPLQQGCARFQQNENRTLNSTSLPHSVHGHHTLSPALATPDEKAAIAALLSLGAV